MAKTSGAAASAERVSSSAGSSMATPRAGQPARKQWWQPVPASTGYYRIVNVGND
ncbi:hypothetical protein ACWCQ1_29210 [Streptomyces sp. NPDC002144]